jgi:hypothetical protein
MAALGRVYVVVEGAPRERADEIEYLRLQAAVLSAPSWSIEHSDALNAVVRFTTGRSAKQSRAYADVLPKWDPRRWKALWDARRCERELAEAGDE